MLVPCAVPKLGGDSQRRERRAPKKSGERAASISLVVSAQELAIRGYAEEEYDGSHLRISPIGTRLIERFIEGNM
jgi:hypothetical protein